MEVQGYASAADWVYGHGIDPGEWAATEPLTLTDLRHVHRLAMAPVWAASPHPDATAREGPGSFREHDIEPFPGVMRPPPWPDVGASVNDWIAETSGTDGCIAECVS